MKYFYPLLVTIYITSSCSPKATTGWEYNNPKNGGFEKFYSPKHFEKTMDKMCKEYGLRLVEGGTFTRKISKEIKLNSNQNNVLYNPGEARITISSFYMSDHEVTNKEYRKFVTWVKNNQSQDFIYHGEKPTYLVGCIDSNLVKNPIANPIYILPDTNVWLKNSFYNPKDSLHRFYFSHPYFDNYPVVGVSKNQAKAYLNWLTQRINEEQREKWADVEDGLKEGIFIPPLRFPTEAEYRYALNSAAGLDNTNYEHKQFSLKNKKGKHTANFGEVKDNNNILLKGFTENKGQDKYTTIVKSFDSEEVVVSYFNGKAKRHDYEIYDLHGNVEEWVLDNLIKDTIKLVKKGLRGNVYDSNIKQDMIDTTDYEERKYVSPYLMDYFTLNFDPKIDEFISTRNYLPLKNVSYEQIIPYKLTVNDDDKIAAKKYIYLRDSLRAYDYKWDENIEIRASRDLHNLKALDKLKEPCITIGGSWADNQAILLNHMVKVYEKNESSATVGFRIAFDRLGNMPFGLDYPFYLKKKRN